MSNQRLRDDERAQSETTGVILMVAVTFVLGAIVGSAAYGVYATEVEQIPSTNFEYDYDDANEQLTITHESGSTFEGPRVRFRKAGEQGGLSPANWSSEPEVSSGESITISGVEADDTVLVIWISERKNGGSTVLSRWPAD